MDVDKSNFEENFKFIEQNLMKNPQLSFIAFDLEMSGIYGEKISYDDLCCERYSLSLIPPTKY